MHKRAVAVFLILSVMFSALAHEYILLAHKYKVVRGGSLELHLFVADGFNIEFERPLQKPMTRNFVLINENGTTDLLATSRDSNLPALTRTVDFDGLGLIHMERDYAKITLDNKKFREYLKEDHIENIKPADDSSSQRERYTRYIKCLVQSGEPGKDTLYRTLTGQNLEIILLANPYRLKKNGLLRAKVLFMGKALGGKVITARNRTGSEPATKQLSRTDANGICSFRINREGNWFLHTTHMIECPDKKEADWESFWASYSFGIEF